MARRRSNHEGTIYKNANGSFRVQIRLNGNRLSHTAKTQKECVEWRKKTIVQIDQGLTYAGAQTTLAEFLEGWLVSIKIVTPWKKAGITMNICHIRKLSQRLVDINSKI